MLTYKGRIIQYRPEPAGEGFFLILDGRATSNVLGHTNTCRQALEFIDELEKQTTMLLERNFA